MSKPNNTLFKQGRSNNWTHKFQWRDKNGKKGSYQKSFGTPDKELAYQRYYEVLDTLDDIKEGLRFEYSWERKSKHSKIKIKTLKDISELYIQTRLIEGLNPQTIERFKYAYKNLVKSNMIGEKSSIKILCDADFDDFKKYWQGKHSPNTIWINLSKIRAFMNWCKRKGFIKKVPTIEVKYIPKPISYFTDQEFNSLMKSSLKDKWKRAFLFYRETGCRKREPFKSTLVGNTLIIDPLKQKDKPRRITLSDVLVAIYNEMMSDYVYRRKELKHKAKSIWDSYYDKLIEGCKEVEIRHTLHDLRDTYAVRQWAITGDIHLVSQMMGHSSITQTAEYAQFKPDELYNHFPTLRAYIEPRLIDPNSLMDHTKTDHTIRNILPSIDKKSLN